MSNYIDTLSEKFLAISKSAATKVSRSDLEKDLKKARKMYNVYRTNLELALKKKEQIEKEIAVAEQGMSSSKKTVLRNHELLRNMDLAGTDNIQIGDDEDVLYIIDGKKYVGSFDDDCNVTLTPWSRKNKNDENISEENVSSDTNEDVSNTDDNYFWEF